MRQQKHTFLGLVSSYTIVVCQRFPSCRPGGLLRHCSSPAYRLHILPHLFLFDERTCGSPTSGIWPQHSSIQKASPCNSGWMQSSLDLVRYDLIVAEEGIHELKSLCLIVEFTNWSIRGKGKLSFGHAWLRFVKSTHILYLPLFLFTITILASHSR